MTTPTRQSQVQTLVNLPRRLDGLECRNMDRSARGTIAPAGGAKTSPSRDTAAVSAQQMTTPTPATNTFCADCKQPIAAGQQARRILDDYDKRTTRGSQALCGACFMQWYRRTKSPPSTVSEHGSLNTWTARL